MSKTLFRQSSLDRISSPEQLNDYIRVSTPSIWIVLVALFVVLAGVFVWGVTGSLPTSVTASGFVTGGEAFCYLDVSEAGKVRAGQEVKASLPNQDDIFRGMVKSVGTIPLSSSEIANELNSDYLTGVLAGEGFAVKVAVSLDTEAIPEGTLLNLNIVTDEIRPIDFLLE